MQKLLQKLLLIVAMMVVPWVTQAQDVQDYAFTTGVDSTMWITMSSSATHVTAIEGEDDAASSCINIGFPFNFGGTTYTQFSCNSNGRIRLGSTVCSNYWSPVFTQLTDASANDLPVVAAFSMDNTLEASGSYVKYELVGTAPERILVIEYYTPSEYDEYGDLVKYQVQLLEDSNKVRFVYGPTAASYYDDYQIGIAASADDYLMINASTHTSFSSTSSTNSSWPGVYRYYDFTPYIPDCQRPSSPTFDSIGSNTVTFSFSELGSATSWLVRLGSNEQVVTDTTVTLTGLSPNMQYTLMLASLCGGDTSSWRTATFRTGCGLINVLPYSNDFEDEPSYSSTTYANAFPACWTRINDATGSYNYYPYIYATSTYAHSGSKGMYWYFSTSTTYANNEYAVLPGIDTTVYDISDLTLSFYVKTTSSSYHPAPIVGVMTDPTDASTFTPVYTFSSTEVTPNWAMHVTSFADYTGYGNYIAIKCPRPSSTAYMAIDDIYLTDEWCDIPLNVEALPGLDEVTLSWESNGGTTFEVVLGTDTVSNITDTFYTFTSLTPNTEYTYAVATLCSGNPSMFIGGSVRTLCTMMDSLPYSMSFEASEGVSSGGSTSHTFVNCWTRLNNGSSYFGYPYVGASTTYAHTGSRGLYWYNTTTTGTYGDYQLVALPGVDTTMYTISNLELIFWAKSSSTSYNPPLEVGVMTNPADYSSFQSVQTVNVGNSTQWNKFVVNLSNFTGYGAFVAIRATRATWTCYVDDIELREQRDCPTPINLEALSTTVADSVVIGWSCPGSDGNDFDIAISTPGFDPDTMDVVYMLSSSYDSTYTFTTLTGGQPYDVYVRTNCSTEPSYWAGPITITPGSMNMQVSGTQTVYMCGGTIYDDGGPNGNYSASCNSTLYIYPSDSTKALVISGVSYTEGTYDYLRIYEGHRTSGTALFDDYGVSSTQTFGPFITGGGPVTITFHSDGSVFYSGFQINVSCIDLPDCERPTNFAVTRLLSDTVEFSWTDPSGEGSEWIIQYGPEGFNRHNENDTSVHWANFYTTSGVIDGLTPNTEYDFYLMQYCGADTSIPQHITLTTPCVSFPTDSLPYHYGFEDATTGSSGHINSCWRKGVLGSTTNYPYASTSYHAEGTKSLYFYGYSDTYKCYAAMPLFEAPIRDLMITFKLYKTSDSYGSIEVGVMNDPNDMNTFTTVGVFQPSITSQWQEFSQTFRNYTGTGQYIAFMQRTTYYTYLDDITVDLAPTCPPASNVAVEDMTTSSAFVTWGFLPGYADVPEYYAVTLVDSNDTRVVDTTSNLYFMFTALDPNSDYRVVVNPVCNGNLAGGDSTSFSTGQFGCLIPDTSSFDTIAIGNGSSTSSYLPSYSFYNYGLSQQIYTAAEINGSRRLTGIAVMPQAITTQRTYEIYLAHTNATSSSLSGYIHPSGMVKVYNGAAVTLTPNQWAVYTFDTPFDYNGSDNLLVCFRDLTGSYTSGNYFYAHSISGHSLYSYQDSGPYDPLTASGGNSTSYRNNIKLMGSGCAVQDVCAKPLVHVVNMADTAVELVWAAGGTENVWDVAHREVGDTAWTIDLASTSAKSYVITPLTPNTSYEFRVSHMCSGLYATVVSATTPCSPTALPMSEGFMTWSTGSASPAASCWHKISTYSSGYPYVTTGYSSDGDNRSVYFYSSSSAYSALVLPPFEASVDTLTLTFSLMRTNTSYTHALQVGVVTDPEDMSTFQLVGQALPGDIYEWSYHEFSFHGMPDGYIAIRTTPGSYCYPYLDEISVNYFNPCIRPYGFDATNVTLTTATITWSDTAASDFEYEYGPAGFTRGTGTFGTTSGTSVLLNGLRQGTNYDIYVRGICSAGDTSLWSFRYRFATACGLIDSLPYYEDFNSWGTGTGVHAPNCWTYGSDYSTSYPYIYSSYNHTGTGGSMYMYNYTGSNANALTYFSLPAVDTNHFTTNQLQVVFWGYTSTTSYQHNVIVGACTDPYDMSTFYPVDTVTVPYGEWNIYEVPLDSVPANARYITLVSRPGTGYNTSYPCIDDLTVEMIPTCPRPDSLYADSATLNSVVLWWHERGNANEWIVEYGPRGFQPGTGTQVYAATNPFVLTGLPASYDGEYYVRSICSGSDTGLYSRSGCYFNTLQAPATIPYYCDFDDTIEAYAWQTNSNSDINWAVGTAVSDSGRAMYVSPDHGVTYGNAGFTSLVNATAYRDIDFGTVDSSFTITFRAKAGGTISNTYDGMMVFLVDPSAPVVASTSAITSPWGNVNSLYRVIRVRLDTNWRTYQASFDTIHGIHRVAFFWFNQNTGGSYPYIGGPAAVDNIHIDYSSCTRPVNLTVDSTSITSTSALLEWSGPSSGQYRVAYRVNGEPASTNQYINVNTNRVVLTGLTPMFTYLAWVQKICGSDSSLFSDGVSFSTLMCENAFVVTPGDSTSTTSTSYVYPVNNYYRYTASEIIIDSAEIGGPLELNAIKFYYDYSTASTVKNTVDIYLKPTTKTSFSNTSDYEIVDSTAQLVYSGPLNCVQGWNTFAFNNVYSYDGTTNLMVIVDDNSNAYNGSAYVFRNRTCTSEKTLVYYSDTYNPDVTDASAMSSYSGTRVSYAYRPEMQLVSCGSISVCHEPIITAINHTYESATISWYGEGTDYEVNIKESAATSWPTPDIHVTGNTYTFTGLQPTTNYTFRVRQDCTADSMGYSEWVLDGVLTDSLPCLAPDSLTVSNITNATATFDWTPVGNETAWELHVWYSGDIDITYPATSHPATVGGFSPGITYQATVRALCGSAHNIVGEWGDTITFTTAVCPNVTGLTASVNQNSITLNWTADPLAVSWEIEYGFQGFDQGTGTTVTSSTNTYTINGLMDDMSYDFHVRAICGTNWYSEAYTTVTATTGSASITCNTPTAVTATVAGNSATVSWTAGAGNISFELEYGTRGFARGSGTTVTATASPATLTGLAYETDYDVYVRAYCGESTYSDWSPVVSFTTEPQGSEDCDPVTALSASNVTESSALITWTPGNTGDEWEVVLTNAGGTTLSEASTTEHQYQFSSLTPGTSYVAKVRTVCGDGQYSDFVSTSFTTQSVGIDEVEGTTCAIFPNPTSGSTTITVTGVNGKVKIAVVDMNGREVASETLDCSGDCAKTMDVDHLAQGAYFVRITGENVSMVRKLIVR